MQQSPDNKMEFSRMSKPLRRTSRVSIIMTKKSAESISPVDPVISSRMIKSSFLFLCVQQAPPSLEHDGFIELEQEAQVWEGIVQDALDGILELYAVVL